jgi:hypothetical protein
MTTVKRESDLPDMKSPKVTERIEGLLTVSSPRQVRFHRWSTFLPVARAAPSSPKRSGRLMKGMGWIGSLMFRFGAKVQGRPLLRLTYERRQVRKTPRDGARVVL